jgi:hypothetical protein
VAGHESRIAQRRQVDEEDGVRPVGERAPRRLEREPRLADAADAGQGDEARLGQQPGDVGELALPADEARERRRQSLSLRGRGRGRGLDLLAQDRLLERP